uniref:Uncharacterized protein n=1 Tax=Bos indicus x Bos taurus TaxID=30522 RepID=A0A4W2E766_BOBOX
MPALGTVCSLLLLSALWVDLARVGSSSLSLKHQKVQVRHLPTNQPPLCPPRSTQLDSRTLPRSHAALRGTSPR